MSTVTITADEKFTAETPLLIVGAGAAGLCAALAAKEAGVDAVLIERDAVSAGSTAAPVTLTAWNGGAQPCSAVNFRP